MKKVVHCQVIPLEIRQFVATCEMSQSQTIKKRQKSYLNSPAIIEK